MVPDMLYNMLAWILASDTEYCPKQVTNLPNHVHCWILSLGQSLIHRDTRSRIKTPKHLLLPMTVKSLTENKKVVTVPNRFGHGQGRGRTLDYPWDFFCGQMIHRKLRSHPVRKQPTSPAGGKIKIDGDSFVQLVSKMAKCFHRR